MQQQRKRAHLAEQDGDVAAQNLRALAFACLDFEDAASDALLDAWFAADAARRVSTSALAARHLGGALANVMMGNVKNVARISARQGNLRCLRWALARSVDTTAVSRICAENGHLACLAFLHEHGCPWNEYTCACAASAGNLACLTYAHERGCPWDALTCICAARKGHLACLTYAREHGCPWDADTCRTAAQNGHLACLKYAHEHGCAWDKYTSSGAAQNGYLDCLAYLREHGCPE